MQFFFCNGLVPMLSRQRQPCWCVVCQGRLMSHDVARRHNNRPRYVESKVEDPHDRPEADVDSPVENIRHPDIKEKFCIELAAEVATGRVRATGAGNVLKLTRAAYEEHLPEGVDMPSSWHAVQRVAISGREPHSFTRDFCPSCGWLFPDDVLTHVCMECEADRYDRNGHPQVTAIYFDLKWRLHNLFSDPILSRKLVASENFEPVDQPASQRILRDVFDGSIMQEHTARFNETIRCIYIYIYIYIDIYLYTTCHFVLEAASLPPPPHRHRQGARQWHGGEG